MKYCISYDKNTKWQNNAFIMPFSKYLCCSLTFTYAYFTLSVLNEICKVLLVDSAGFLALDIFKGGTVTVVPSYVLLSFLNCVRS